MRIIVVCIAAFLSLNSCSKYVQVATVKSDILKNDSLLRYENDTFEIVYNLFDENGLVAFSIYNKSDKPLYIDWKRSAFIQGQNRKLYWEDNATFFSVTQGNSYEWFRGYNRSRNYSYGVISKPEQVSFIPPKTAVGMAKFKISSYVYQGKLEEKKVPASYKKGTTKVLTKNFADTASPITFRNFLTLSLNHDFSTEFYIDHFFWVDKVEHMKQRQFGGPSILVKEEGSNFEVYDYSYPTKKPNLFYNRISNDITPD